ncbi:MAG: sulfatase-like hydrolase/transferase [Gammaproteobacteria bacterium]|nr:sulfatase-like hydrolase/transferase [Gammaproteobacteria bacterium]
MTSSNWGPFKKRPNILIIMTDQQRSIQHFPEGWAEENLPGLNWLKNNGISFTNAFISTSPSSPSRGVLFTGLCQSKTGVWVIGDTLPYQIKTMGYVMAKKGYDVAYKGKWHLNRCFDYAGANRPPDLQTMESEDYQMKCRDFPGWTSPDFGCGAAPDPDNSSDCSAQLLGPAHYQLPWQPPSQNPNQSSLNTTGGGTSNNDGRIVNGPLYSQKQESAIDFLKNRKGSNPFFMVVSMMNPHDISIYPYGYKKAGYSESDIEGKAYSKFELPRNYDDSLRTKPTAQRMFAEQAKEEGVDPCDPELSLDTLKFYAYLHTLPDQLTVEIIDALREENLLDDTLIVRIADHGEMGLSHKLRSKCYNIYQETVNVPMIFSNPKLLKECYGGKPAQTRNLASLIDIMPTMASIAGWTREELEKEKIYLQGKDISKTVLDPSSPTQDCVVYTYQAESPKAEHADTINSNNIRAIFDGVWKYGVYFALGSSPSPQYEMYHLAEDPDELENRLFNPKPEDIEQAKTMHKKLTEELKKADMIPPNWEKIPPYKEWKNCL